MLAPGSFNKKSFVFQMPKLLEDKYPVELYIDVRDEDISIPVTNKNAVTEVLKDFYQGEDIKLYVNSLSRLSKIDKSSGEWVVADITIEDVKDGDAIRGISKLFSLVREGAPQTTENKDENIAGSAGLGSLSGSSNVNNIYSLNTDVMTDKLILGFGGESVVYDGTKRRGYLVFKIPSQLKN